jgi:hypothetical protein
MNFRLKKKSIIWWILQIFPPLFILPLSTMPIDIVTSIFWFAGLIAFIVSFLNVGRKILSLIRNKESKLILLDMIRPTLTIFFIILVISSVKYSLSKAESFAFETAKNIQNRCNVDNICPECIPTWEKRDDSSICESIAGGLAKYRVLYLLNNDKKQFRIMLRIYIDRFLIFYGGVGKQIERDFK